MLSLTTLLLFSLAVLALFVSPGPNMAFVLSHGMAYGTRGGFAAAMGIAIADVVLTVLTATGVTAMVVAWPPAFDLLRYAGAAYLLWLAIKVVCTPATTLLHKETQVASGKIFFNALLNCLLNPKALLFFMVFLPQFVDIARGAIALQLLMLGLVLSSLGLVFNTLLGIFSARIGQWVYSNPHAIRLQAWLLASVLAALALRLLLTESPRKIV